MTIETSFAIIGELFAVRALDSFARLDPLYLPPPELVSFETIYNLGMGSV
jgi:hypothetical protein